jgi:thiosulfate/3-mercaptopyruvate sulfurtransferase
MSLPIVSTQVLSQWLARALPPIKVLDVRHQLMDKAWGRAQFLAGHIPGAQFVDLEQDLSDLSRTQELGRHPLPSAERFAALLSSLGIAHSERVVCYDQDSGAFAARAWWMLRALGMREVYVLDGGFAAWQREGRQLQTAVDTFEPAKAWLNPSFANGLQIDLATLRRELANDAIILLDARAANRFAGRDEIIDPIAGHVPGAINRPFSDNLNAGVFKPAQQLRTEFQALLGTREPEQVSPNRRHDRQVALMCGSGVTACHNALAMEIAGLPGARLFAPSWSGWILQKAPEVATGE